MGADGRTPRRRSSAKQALDTHVFVDFRPVDSVSRSGDLKATALFGRGVQEPGKPCKWSADRAAVGQCSANGVLRARHLHDSFTRRCHVHVPSSASTSWKTLPLVLSQAMSPSLVGFCRVILKPIRTVLDGFTSPRQAGGRIASAALVLVGTAR